jgi:partner of Y14 and mago protein
MVENSVRKEIKIRPGFTPQEDVGRFKTSRQQTAEKNALPKGHIVGWAPPSSSQSKSQASSSSAGAKVPTTDASGQPLSKAALKNAKRKAKKLAEKANVTVAGSTPTQDSEEEGERLAVEAVDDAPETWDEEGDEEAPAADAPPPGDNDTSAKGRQSRTDPGVDAVAKELDKLAVSK